MGVKLERYGSYGREIWVCFVEDVTNFFNVFKIVVFDVLLTIGKPFLCEMFFLFVWLSATRKVDSLFFMPRNK